MSDKITRTKVTREIVVAVKKKLADPKYIALSQEDIGMLCGTSGTTVGRIRDGKYDFMLDEKENKYEDLNDCMGEILAELRAIKDLLVDLSTSSENEATDD